MKKNLQENIRNLCIALLILLWTYSSLSKLINFQESLISMRNQLFPLWTASVLSILLPILELCVAGFLLFASYRIIGSWISLILLSAFTLYIIGIELLLFGRIPCSCGGIISGFSWTQHLIFNLTFITINLTLLITNGHSKIPVQRKEHA